MTGSVALLTAALGGISVPAQAGTHSIAGAGKSHVISGEDQRGDGAGVARTSMDRDKDKDKDKDKLGRCISIDSWISGSTQSLVAVRDGEIFAGIRGLDPTVDSFEWLPISTLDGVTIDDACDATIADMGNEVFIEVITKTGEVWETICGIDRGDEAAPQLPALAPELDCDTAWTLTDEQLPPNSN